MVTHLSLKNRISASRKLLGNQYAYLDGEGELSVLLPGEPPILAEFKKPKSRQCGGWIDAKIKKKVRELHQSIWKHREELSPTGVSADPVDLLDPAIAAKLIGFNFERSVILGEYTKSGIKFEVAGEVDRRRKRIRISPQLSLAAQRFTGAHELGHAVMHEHAQMHRDRPLDAPGQSLEKREKKEKEADVFAACFLMPENLLRQRFRELFLCDRFVFNDDTIFALNQTNSERLYQRGKGTLRSRARILADATTYGGKHFISLADQFHVSVETIAIRLEELGLIEI